MARRQKEEFNWLDDPFDERKQANDPANKGMTAGSTTAIGCGCFAIIVIVLVVVGLVFGAAAVQDLMI